MKNTQSECECGRRKEAAARACARCIGIESWVQAEQRRETYALRVPTSHQGTMSSRTSLNRAAAANPLKSGNLITINRACDAFLKLRGLLSPVNSNFIEAS